MNERQPGSWIEKDDKLEPNLNDDAMKHRHDEARKEATPAADKKTEVKSNAGK